MLDSRQRLVCLLIVTTGVLGATTAQATVTTVTTFSASNNRNVSFQVYTPPGYATNTTRRYPTVFSLHGIGGQSLQRANLYAPTLDARINAGEVQPMIWVFPDGQTNSFYGDSFDGHKQVYSAIISEALPYVDANFRTIADRTQRAMEGFSMGGFGAALYTAKHPELFSAIVEYGGALSNWQNLTQFNAAVASEMYNTIEANWLPFSLWDQTTANAEALRTQINYKMIVGDADSQYQSNIRFRDHLLSLNIDPHFQVLPGVEHLGGSYLNEGSGLEFLDQHFASMNDPTGDFDGDSDADGSDFLLWQRQYALTGDRGADGNRDGRVDGADLAAWRVDFGAQGLDQALAGGLPAPEPSGFALTACLMACGGRYRRHTQTPRS